MFITLLCLGLYSNRLCYYQISKHYFALRAFSRLCVSLGGTDWRAGKQPVQPRSEAVTRVGQRDLEKFLHYTFSESTCILSNYSFLTVFEIRIAMWSCRIRRSLAYLLLTSGLLSPSLSKDSWSYSSLYSPKIKDLIFVFLILHVSSVE